MFVQSSPGKATTEIYQACACMMGKPERGWWSFRDWECLSEVVWIAPFCAVSPQAACQCCDGHSITSPTSSALPVNC